MSPLAYLRASLRKNVASLLDVPIAETDPRYDEYMIVMGADFFAEAHPSVEARNLAAGPVNKYVEFVPVTAAEVAEVEYPVERLAIGPGFGEPGFNEVADIVLSAIVADHENRDGSLWGPISVTIARTGYTLQLNEGTDLPTVSWHSLFNVPMGDRERKTAAWLQTYFAPGTGSWQATPQA